MKPLRDYQQRAVEDVIAAIHERPVLVLPTGGGKTRVAVEIIQRLGLRTLFLAHLRELIEQAANALRENGADSVGIVMAGHPSNQAAQVQVASINTLVRRQIEPPGLIVLDECHHAKASTYESILARYPGALRLGLTATPFRGDRRGLGDLFGRIVVGAYADELVASGVLIEPVVYAPGNPDLSGVHIRKGEFVQTDLSKAMQKPKIVGDVVATWRQHGFRPDGSPRRTVVFSVNVEHSRRNVEAFNQARITAPDGTPVRAEHLDGGHAKGARKATLHRWRSGWTTIVSNCALFGEGFDLPDLEVAIDTAPTMPVGKHLQRIGRIVRSSSGKTGAIYLDHAGNHLRIGVFMTDRLDYTLDDGLVQARTGAGGPRSKRCARCFLICSASARECHGCGAPFAAEVPRHHEGELVELRRDPQPTLFGDRPGARPPLSVQQERWDRLEIRRKAFDLAEGWSYVEFHRWYGFRPLIFDGRVVDPADAGSHVIGMEFDRLDEIRRVKSYNPTWTGVQLGEMFGARGWSYFHGQRKKHTGAA